MKIIVAVDIAWGIGYKGNLLAHIPEDLKYFKEMTIGKVVVMGEETYKSLPEGKSLKGRINIVLSNTLKDNSVLAFSSIKELLVELKKYNKNDIFVIGGESVYNQLLAYCNEAYVTKINNIYKSDKHFNNLDKNKDWKLIHEGESKYFDGIEFKFTKYVRYSS